MSVLGVAWASRQLCAEAGRRDACLPRATCPCHDGDIVRLTSLCVTPAEEVARVDPNALCRPRGTPNQRVGVNTLHLDCVVSAYS
jgi:hypothetical protein